MDESVLRAPSLGPIAVHVAGFTRELVRRGYAERRRRLAVQRLCPGQHVRYALATGRRSGFTAGTATQHSSMRATCKPPASS